MVEVSPTATMGLGAVGGVKRQMPIQLALSIGPTGVGSVSGQAVLTQQGKCIIVLLFKSLHYN